MSEGALPPPEPLGAAMEQVPYCIVADDAFPIKPYIMKPFPMHDMTMPQRIFNYRLSRSGRIIENVFGIRFMNYFMAEGDVPWQYRAVGAGNF